MKTIQRLFLYLLNPRSGTWGIEAPSEEIQPRRVPWKGIFNPPFVLGTLILVFLIVIVWFGPTFANYDPYITSRSVVTHYDAEARAMVKPPFPPSPVHPLGTDRFGNDILSLLLFGARVTLISCVYITVSRVFLGLILGGIAGWHAGSRFDRLVMQLGAVISSVPLLLSSMLMILALDIHKGLWVFLVALSALGWTEIAQLVRGEFIRIKEMLFIEAAQALGLTRLQIITRHALPNVLSYLLSISFLEMGSILLILAELGFLGLYVGGGSRFMYDPFQPVVTLISEIPEWGAMVAQGTPNIRPYPFMVMGPAVAFFISILGLNAFGEGLRRIFDRWPFSTAFILKKRMLLLIAAFIGVTAFIFQKTNAEVSYQQVAETFDEDSLVARYEELKIYNSIARENESDPLVEYIISKMKEYDFGQGWSETLTSLYYYPASTTILRPKTEPRLEVGNRDHFHYLKEFSYMTEGCAGSGSAAGPVVLLGGLSPDLDQELEGKILMLLEAAASPQLWEQAAAAGVGGVLLVREDPPPLASQYESSQDPEDESCQFGSIPVFNITGAVARRITAQAGWDWNQLLTKAGVGIYPVDLGLQGSMELDLSPPQTVDVPNIIGFEGGYDFDHADEIVVIYTTFDGLGLSEFQQEKVPEDDLARIAMLLEIMRDWKDHKLDPRRSVQFVIWGGEGVEEPFYQMFYGLFEKNKLVAKVPTNPNPYINTNPVKPAIWVEIGDLNIADSALDYSQRDSVFLGQLLLKASRATDQPVTSAQLPAYSVNSGLPSLYLWDYALPTPSFEFDVDGFSRTGVLVSRTLIQLLRDMRN
jgi:ABC-type dipeptide/oligopeptide/nickel transport system permease subunit